MKLLTSALAVVAILVVSVMAQSGQAQAVVEPEQLIEPLQPTQLYIVGRSVEF